MTAEHNSDNMFKDEILTENKHKFDKPKMYKVLLHNDHYTTMDFVVEVLTSIFHIQVTQANQVMLDVHKKGIGICGVYSRDIAATKVSQVHKLAKSREFPLKCSYELA
jgi:ATP-dependent Clp protease adaptor protein ClpS